MCCSSPTGPLSFAASRRAEAHELAGLERSAVAATDPACAGDAGYRAIVVVNESWLDLGSDGLSPRDQGMTTAVRWSTERVCIEAVEVGEGAAPQMDPPPQLRVVARFVPKPGATRLATIGGVDLRQSLTCDLPPQR